MHQQALQAFQEYREDRFTKKIVFKEQDHVVFVLNFAPGQTLPAHNHPGATVYLTVLEGRGFMIADDRETPVTVGDLVQVAGHESFAYRGAGVNSSLSVVLIRTPGDAYAQEG